MSLTTWVWLVLAYGVPLLLVALWFSQNPTRRPWQVIAVLILLPVFYMLHFVLLERLQGWPVQARIPDDFQLLAHRVTEPNSMTGDPGGIIIWLQADGRERPRAYALPYDAALHRRLSEAAARLADGIPQRGEHRTEDRPARSGAGAANDAEPDRGVLIFRDGEDHRLPPKPSTL